LAFAVEFNPDPWIGRSRELISIANNSSSVVSLYAESYSDILRDELDEDFFRLNEYVANGDIAGLIEFLESIGEEKLYKLINIAQKSLEKALKRSGIIRFLRSLYRTYPWFPEFRDLHSILIYLSCVLRLAYLYTGNKWARIASILSYAGTEILRIENDIEAARVALYYYSGLLFLLNDNHVKGLALLGWGLRKVLKIKPINKVNPSEKPDVWKAVIEVNYDLDIGPLVDGRLLDKIGFFDYIDKITRQ